MKQHNDTQLLELRGRLSFLQPMMERGIQIENDTGRKYFTGYSYSTLYDWDQYFDAILQIYMGWPSEYIKNGVTIFLDHQQASGLIPRSVPSNKHHDSEHVKPFLSQIALLVQNAYGEVEWILSERYFERLKRYIDYWLVEMDGDGDGLSEWMSAPHTGMDNQHERAGFWLDRFCEGVDLNSYLVRECRAFAKLASLKGEDELSVKYESKADECTKKIRQLCWDEADGFFYDKNVRVGQQLMSRHAGWASALNTNSEELIKVKTVAGLTPLWAKVATVKQAKRLVYEHIFDSGEFWSKYPITVMARSERWYSTDFQHSDLGCNWRAKVWMPINYMMYWGLRWYGYRELASLLAWNTEKLLNKSGNHEYFDAESGEGCGLNPFWGWSLLGYFINYEDSTEEAICAV